MQFEANNIIEYFSHKTKVEKIDNYVNQVLIDELIGFANNKYCFIYTDYWRVDYKKKFEKHEIEEFFQEIKDCYESYYGKTVPEKSVIKHKRDFLRFRAVVSKFILEGERIEKVKAISLFFPKLFSNKSRQVVSRFENVPIFTNDDISIERLENTKDFLNLWSSEYLTKDSKYYSCFIKKDQNIPRPLVKPLRYIDKLYTMVDDIKESIVTMYILENIDEVENPNMAFEDNEENDMIFIKEDIFDYVYNAFNIKEIDILQCAHNISIDSIKQEYNYF